MSNIDVTLRLPEELVTRAKAQGVLSDERIAAFLQAELARIETWNRLDQTLDPIREDFRADHPDMTEDDVLDMMSDIVREVRKDTDSDT